MLKEEFEKMIGKRVDYDTYVMYNAMYTALPENINKQQFVDMLNIKAIPEDPEVIRIKEENEKIKADIKERIRNINNEIKRLNEDTQMYREWIAETDDMELKKLYKGHIKVNNNLIAHLRAEKKEFQFILR